MIGVSIPTRIPNMTLLEPVPEDPVPNDALDSRTVSHLLLSYPAANATPEFSACMLRFVAFLTQKEVSWELFVVPPAASAVDAKRIALERFATVETPATHAILFDSDITFEPTDAWRLATEVPAEGIAAAACPVSRIRWTQFGRALGDVDESSERTAQDVARAMARSLEYAVVMHPNKTDHAIENGWMDVDAVGLGMACVSREVMRVVWSDLEAATNDPFEVRLCRLLRDKGFGTHVHVATPVGRTLPVHFPGSFWETVREHVVVPGEHADGT